jgi:hypothetical protein
MILRDFLMVQDTDYFCMPLAGRFISAAIKLAQSISFSVAVNYYPVHLYLPVKVGSLYKPCGISSTTRIEPIPESIFSWVTTMNAKMRIIRKILRKSKTMVQYFNYVIKSCKGS